MTKPGVSAIVVSYHTGPRLKECLYGLSSDPDIDQIIVVDNGNPAGMRQWLIAFEARIDRCETVRNGANIGFGAGVNLGARQATGEHLLIINPDAVIKRGAVTPLLETAATLSEPWIVGGKIFNLKGEEERGPRRRELTLWRAITSALGWNTWTLEKTPAPSGPIRMDVISGAFFLMSKAGFEALGGFDEGYFLHVEDVDLCDRCRAAGGPVMYDPRAGALHYGSTSDVPARVVSGHKRDSLARYFRARAKGPVHLAITELVLFGMRLGTR